MTVPIEHRPGWTTTQPDSNSGPFASAKLVEKLGQ
jgi:hypothetical protein